jgi:hypothetical protein
VITGGTGMIGTWLAHTLRARGDDVYILTRGKPVFGGELQWNPLKNIPKVEVLEGMDAVVHLAGAPIADRPWTKARRTVLRDSRIQCTKILLRELSRLKSPPKHFIGCGGLGRFGDRGEELLDDDDEAGTGFLADLAVDWEEAQMKATTLGCRTAVLRMSIVLSPTGGAFPLMVKPFRVGIGGWLGNGRQHTSWISIRDAVGAFAFLLDNVTCVGGFNGTAPEASRNKEWCKALGRVLNRPVLTHAPKWALRGALGELADDLFLASLRPIPRKLQQAGYKFVDSDIEATFRWLVDELDNDGPSMKYAPAARKRR